MSTNEFTPPPKLLQQWEKEAIAPDGLPTEAKWQRKFATLAAQWGADQELEACCHYFSRDLRESLALELRIARRLDPPSLAQEALAELNLTADCMGAIVSCAQVELIRRALERLQQLENNQ